MTEQKDRQPDLSELNIEQLPADESFEKWLERQAKLPQTAGNRWVGKIVLVPAGIVLAATAVASIGYSIYILRGQPSQLIDQAVETQAAENQTEADLVLTPIPTPEIQVPRTISLEQVLKEKPTLIADFKNSIANLSDEQAMANLRLYIDDGAAFRRKVLYVQLKGLEEGELSVLQSYPFLKDAVGFETSEGGRPHQVEEYSIDDIVRVKDFKRQGIFLRQRPTLEIDPTDPFTYDGNSLMILEGPYDLLDEIKEEAWRMWRARKVWWCGPSLGWQGNACYAREYQPEEGLIWQGWFGGKHPFSGQ